MAPESFIYIGTGLSILILLILSFKGKISPLLTLIILLVAASTAILISSNIHWDDKSIEAGTVKDIPTSVVNDSTLAKSTEETGLPPATLEKRDPQKIEPKPRDYKVPDKKYWTYKTKGFWNWNSTFKDNLFIESGWNYQKKGNYTIEVGHTGKFTNDKSQNEQRFIYSGGELEIKVNDGICCCQGSVLIRAGIFGKNMAEVKNNIQKEIDSLMEKDENLVIQKIVSCF